MASAIECSNAWLAAECQPTYSQLVDVLANITINADISPDPRMQNTTDVYLVPLDDIEAARELLQSIKR